MIHKRHIEELVAANDAGIGDAMDSLFNQNFLILNWNSVEMTFPTCGSLTSLTCEQLYPEGRSDCSVLQWTAELDGSGAPAYIMAGMTFKIGYYISGLSLDIFKQIYKLGAGREPKGDEIPYFLFKTGFYTSQQEPNTPSTAIVGGSRIERGDPVNHTAPITGGFSNVVLTEWCWADGVKQTECPQFSNKWSLDGYYYVDGKPYGEHTDDNTVRGLWLLEIPAAYSKAKHIKWYTT
jgi:hypothetical protein